MEFTYGKSLSGIAHAYQKSGFVIVKKVIDPDLVEEGQRHVAWLLKKNPGTRPEQLHHTLVADDPFWVRFISDHRLLDIAEQFIGPDIALFASHYICKPPKDGQAVLWHQDGSYWPLEPMEVVTLWVALDRTTPDNGCMRVIPGTQALNLQKVTVRDDVPNVLESGLDESTVQAERAVDIILEPGDVSIHHPNIIHGSEANTSDRWRRGLTIRYIPTHTRVTQADWPCVMLLRGKPRAGINRYVPFPDFVSSRHMPFRGCEHWPHYPTDISLRHIKRYTFQ